MRRLFLTAKRRMHTEPELLQSRALLHSPSFARPFGQRTPAGVELLPLPLALLRLVVDAARLRVRDLARLAVLLPAVRPLFLPLEARAFRRAAASADERRLLPERRFAPEELP